VLQLFNLYAFLQLTIVPIYFQIILLEFTKFEAGVRDEKKDFPYR